MVNKNLTLEVLISTMNKDDLSLLEEMNITTDYVVINQCNRSEVLENNISGTYDNMYCYNEKGLSRSRNCAIEKASQNICVIADDDMRFVDNYDKIILEAFHKYNEADIIAFIVERKGNCNKKFRKSSGWQNFFSSMKISSVEISFRRKKIIDKNIKFNENIGAGTEFYLGEENVFLLDCLRKGLKILYLPVKIADVNCGDSSWFEGYNRKYFNSRGASFYNMHYWLYHILIIQFAIRKYRIYRNYCSFLQSIGQMYEGVKNYKEIYE